PIAALSAGEIDYLTGYTTGLVAASQGAPLKGLIVTMRKPPFYIVSEPSIQKPEDLAGKRLAVDRIGSLQHLVARVFLKTKGMNDQLGQREMETGYESRRNRLWTVAFGPRAGRESKPEGTPILLRISL